MRSLRHCGNALGCWSRKTRSYAVPRPMYRRRICREKALPARKRAGDRRDPCGGVVSGVEACGAECIAETDSVAGAGKRGLTPCRGLFIAGESAGKRLYPLVRQLATEGIPVVVSCRVLKLARQPYYRWLHQHVPDADLVAG